MFIVWGRKATYLKQGYVADFCPICRDTRAFEVQRIGSVGHVYYISFGQGDLVGYQRVCRACGTAMHAEKSHYATFAKSPDPFDALKLATFPDYESRHARRIELEQRVRRTPQSLAPAERQELVLEPMIALARKVEKRFAATQVDVRTGLAVLVGLGLWAMIGGLGAHLFPDQPEIAMLVGIGVMVAVIASQGIGQGRRWMRSQIVPPLSRSLQPLQPQREEVVAALAELAGHKLKIGTRLKPEDLLDAMAPARAPVVEAVANPG